jgi:hypothetical protein
MPESKIAIDRGLNRERPTALIALIQTDSRIENAGRSDSKFKRSKSRRKQLVLTVLPTQDLQLGCLRRVVTG